MSTVHPRARRSRPPSTRRYPGYETFSVCGDRSRVDRPPDQPASRRGRSTAPCSSRNQRRRPSVEGADMKAVTWQGKRDVQVSDVADPRIQEPGDAVVRVTSTAICGADLHLYELLGPFMSAGDVLGHEAIGVVEEVGSG